MKQVRAFDRKAEASCIFTVHTLQSTDQVIYKAQCVSLCERVRQVNRKKIVEAAPTKYDILYTDGAVRSYSAVVEHSR